MEFQKELNQKIWDKDNDNQIREEVDSKLREIANAFIEYVEIPEEAVLDVVITGSSASYNYNEHSDLDLHIIVDYDKIHEDCPLVEGYLGALKNTFNKEHDIFIHGIPVELYAEKKDQGTVHNGLYSLWMNKWIDVPQKIKPTDNDAAVEAKFNEIKDMVDKCDDSEEATELLEKIYNMRKAGLAEAGEFCTENLAFKKLRNEGCMDKLRKIKKEQIDKQLSLESYNSVNETLSSRQKELKKVFDKLLKEIHDFGGGKILDIEYKDGERPYYYVDIKNCGDWYKEDEDNECSWDLKWSSHDKFRDIVDKYSRKYRKDKIECNWGKSTWFYEDKKIHIVVRDDSKPHKSLFEGIKKEYSIKNESIKESGEGKNYEDGLWEEVESPYFNYDGYIVISVNPVQNFKSGHFMNIQEYEYEEHYLADEDFTNRIKKYPNENHYVIQCTENGTHYGYIVKRYLTVNKNESIKENKEDYPKNREELINKYKGVFKKNGITLEISNLYNKKEDNFSGGFGKSYNVEGKVFNKFEKALEYMKKLNNKNESINETINKLNDILKEKIQIKFVGVDEWNRPTFKPLDTNKKYYLCDTKHLFNDDVTEQEIKHFYSTQLHSLNDYIVYKGKSFNSEPMGDTMKQELEIVTDNKNESILQSLKTNIKRALGETEDVVEELNLYIVNTSQLYHTYAEPAMELIRAGKEDEVDWFAFALAGAKMYAKDFKPLHPSKEDYDKVAQYLKTYYTNHCGEEFDESMDMVNKTIYKPQLILKAYELEQKYIKEMRAVLELEEDEPVPNIMLFIIENDEIKATRLIPRQLVYTAEVYDNEFYLDRIRDTEDVITDYNLAPAQKLVDTWNKARHWNVKESLEHYNNVLNKALGK